MVKNAALSIAQISPAQFWRERRRLALTIAPDPQFSAASADRDFEYRWRSLSCDRVEDTRLSGDEGFRHFSASHTFRFASRKIRVPELI
jgi:hypothetical protein